MVSRIHEDSVIRPTFPPHGRRLSTALGHTENLERVLKNIDPDFTAEQWLEQLKLGSNWVSFETRFQKNDDDTPAYIRTIEGHCSRPTANLELFKNVTEIPHGWNNVIHHSSSQQYLDNLLFNGQIARSIGRKESKQACYFLAAHPQRSQAVPDLEPQLVPSVHSPQLAYRHHVVKLIWSKHKRWI